MSNLIPERRTDKNGKTSTRWVKPAAAGSDTASIPPPQRAVSELEANLTILTDAIKKAKVDSAALNSALRRASNAEIALLASAVQDDPDHFASMMIREGGASGRVNWAASMALVYDKDYFLETASTQRRTVILNNALRTAYKYVHLIDGTEPELDVAWTDRIGACTTKTPLCKRASKGTSPLRPLFSPERTLHPTGSCLPVPWIALGQTTEKH